MKIYEIREMSSEEIVKRINEEETNLVDLRFQQEFNKHCKAQNSTKRYCEDENYTS